MANRRSNLPHPPASSAFYVTNTTYAYQAIVNGNDGAGFVSGPFKSGDWFQLDIFRPDAGGNDLGHVPIYLADYRNALSVAIDDWTWVDLSSLGDQVSRLEFAMNSTDVGPFGVNTPAYFAMDNLTFSTGDDPLLPGDFDGTGILDAADINALTWAASTFENVVQFDLDADARVDSSDIRVWIKELKGSWIGDANLDGQFNSTDLVSLFSAGTYEHDTDATWNTGDFNGDARFSSTDLVAALADGGYDRGVLGAASSVPEPNSLTLLALLPLAWRRALMRT